MRFPARQRLRLCPGEPADAVTFAAWFRREKPDALIVSHSAPVIAWLRTLGRQVPRAVGLVEFALHPAQPCAGVRYEPARIGALAVGALVGLLHRNEKGVPVGANEILLEGERRRALAAAATRSAASKKPPVVRAGYP